MKTGTTYLQLLMEANRDNLLAAGFMVVGSRAERARAARDVLGLAGPELGGVCDGAWKRMADQMQAHPELAAVYSMEFLSFADAEQVARIVKSLPGAEIHVILTVRDTSAALPSQWQTTSRNGGTVSWTRFARGILRGMRAGEAAQGSSLRTFLRAQAIPRMLDAWLTAVPAERVHVVTVPPPGADPILLWQRFARVLGVEPAVCSTQPPHANPSLGHASAELMRRLSVRLGALPKRQFRPTLKDQLATVILAQRAGLERPVELDRATTRFAARWNRRVREAITASGAEVVGDLDELPVELPSAGSPPPPPSLPEPTDEEILAAACTARDGLVGLIQARVRHLAARRQATSDVMLSPDDLPTTAGRWAAEPESLEMALDELCQLVRTAIALDERLKAGSGSPGHDVHAG
jgi:hypothetical protein